MTAAELLTKYPYVPGSNAYDFPFGPERLGNGQSRQSRCLGFLGQCAGTEETGPDRESAIPVAAANERRHAWTHKRTVLAVVIEPTARAD